MWMLPSWSQSLGFGYFGSTILANTTFDFRPYWLYQIGNCEPKNLACNLNAHLLLLTNMLLNAMFLLRLQLASLVRIDAGPGLVLFLQGWTWLMVTEVKCNLWQRSGKRRMCWARCSLGWNGKNPVARWRQLENWWSRTFVRATATATTLWSWGWWWGSEQEAADNLRLALTLGHRSLPPCPTEVNCGKFPTQNAAHIWSSWPNLSFKWLGS